MFFKLLIMYNEKTMLNHREIANQILLNLISNKTMLTKITSFTI